MDGYLRQSTASQARAIGPFVDDTDFKTAETGLTIANTDIKLRANGTTLSNKNSGGGTHQVNGMYSLTWDATDTANVGELKYSVVVSGALQVFGSYVVLEEAVYDALFSASAAGYQVPIWAAAGSTVNLSATTVATVGAVSGAVGSVTGNVGGSVGSLATQAKADVNAEVLDVLTVDTFAEPGQGTPPATTTLANKIAYPYKSWRNKGTATSSQRSLFADDASTVDQKWATSDDGTTYTKGEVGTGP